tara:strand:+ start:1739 stop:1849 length:111 start_codon:yes stop_codon:yes gene_type:complete
MVSIPIDKITIPDAVFEQDFTSLELDSFMKQQRYNK